MVPRCSVAADSVVHQLKDLQDKVQLYAAEMDKVRAKADRVSLSCEARTPGKEALTAGPQVEAEKVKFEQKLNDSESEVENLRSQLQHQVPVPAACVHRRALPTQY